MRVSGLICRQELILAFCGVVEDVLKVGDPHWCLFEERCETVQRVLWHCGSVAAGQPTGTERGIDGGLAAMLGIKRLAIRSLDLRSRRWSRGVVAASKGKDGRERPEWSTARRARGMSCREERENGQRCWRPTVSVWGRVQMESCPGRATTLKEA